MTRYAHPDVLDNGLAYIQSHCDKVILATAYTNVYATANGANKIAVCALVSGDFAISGADGAARTLTATLMDKAAGNAARALADGTGMHLVFVDTTTSKVLFVTEESSNQAIVSGNPVVLKSNPTYVSNQPTA